MTSNDKIDGRVQRGERNRTAIVDALLSLLEEGDMSPSARDIAERAGVSLRSVFQHYDDLESLYTALIERQAGRVVLDAIDPALPFPERLAKFVNTRTAVYERISPVRRAALVASVESPTLQHGLKQAATMHIRDVST